MEKLPSFVLSRNATTPYYPISALSILNNRKFETWSWSLKRGFKIQWFDLKTFGILENWSLRGDRLQEMVTTVGSTANKKYRYIVKGKKQVQQVKEITTGEQQFKRYC